MHWQLGPNTRIVLGSAAVRPVERAASYLQSQVEKRCGWRWEIAKGGTASHLSPEGLISLARRYHCLGHLLDL